MKITLKKLQRAQPAMQKLMNADLPIKSAFKLSRIAKVINDVFQDLEQQRTKLVQKLGAPSSQGFAVKPENIQVFTEEFETLLGEEVEINIAPLSEDELLLFEEVKLSAMDLVALESILT